MGEIGYTALAAGDTSAKLFHQVYTRLVEGQDKAGFWDFAEGDASDRMMNTAKITTFLRMTQSPPKSMR